MDVPHSATKLSLWSNRNTRPRPLGFCVDRGNFHIYDNLAFDYLVIRGKSLWSGRPIGFSKILRLKTKSTRHSFKQILQSFCSFHSLYFLSVLPPNVLEYFTSSLLINKIILSPSLYRFHNSLPNLNVIVTTM